MRLHLCIAALLAGILLCPVVLSADEATIVVAAQEPLLREYDSSYAEYYRLRIGNVVSYFHQRTIGEATVELDFIRYQFNVNSGELIETTIQWRPGLPQSVDPLITQEQAEATVVGPVKWSRLYFISPQSYVFPLEPTPDNPCWVVRSEAQGRPAVTIIDGMTGDNLGRGVPPPAEGLSLTGPKHSDPNDPNACWDPWDDWYTSALNWFNAMGYSTMARVFPHTAEIGQYVQSGDLAVFYEIAHGGSWSFLNWCSESTTAGHVRNWLGNYANVPFAFIASCEGLCDLGNNTFAYEFRKGIGKGAALIGYCHMEQAQCETCWGVAVPWQDTLFSSLASGLDMADAFAQANLAYPTCAPPNGCMRMAGDGDLTLVPKLIRSVWGNVYDGQGGPFTDNRRPYYVTSDLYVYSGQTLTVSQDVTVGFLNDARIVVSGTLSAVSTAANPTRFVGEMHEDAGITLLGGQMRLISGGVMRIYE